MSAQLGLLDVCIQLQREADSAHGKRPKKVLVELRNVGRSTDDGREGGDTLLLKMAGMSIIVKLVVVKNQPSGGWTGPLKSRLIRPVHLPGLRLGPVARPSSGPTKEQICCH